MNAYIDLQKNDYEQLPDGVRVLVSTIIKKLPGPQRKTYAALNDQRTANQKEAELIQAGLDSSLLSAWVNGFAAQKTTGRSWGVVAKLLGELERLRLVYGVNAINMALLKITGYDEPRKCTIPYLKAVLKADVVTAPHPHPGHRAQLKGGTRHCPDCGAAPGKIHKPGCDQERCSVCGSQYLVCACAGHRHDLAVWQGGEGQGEVTPPVTPQAIWRAILTRLAARMPRVYFDTWLRPLRIVEVTADALVLRADDDVIGYHVQQHYANIIQQEAAALMGRTIALRITTFDPE